MHISATPTLGILNADKIEALVFLRPHESVFEVMLKQHHPTLTVKIHPLRKNAHIFNLPPNKDLTMTLQPNANASIPNNNGI